MLKELVEILQTFGSESVELLKQSHEDAGQVASGKTKEEFDNKVIEDGDKISLQIGGAAHSEYLDRGLSPEDDGFWGSDNRIDVIKQWIRDKGLASQFEKEYQLNSFAFLIVRKISQEGTFHHREGKTFGGVERPISQVFDEERMDKLRELLGKNLQTTISSEITELAKNLEK